VAIGQRQVPQLRTIVLSSVRLFETLSARPTSAEPCHRWGRRCSRTGRVRRSTPSLQVAQAAEQGQPRTNIRVTADPLSPAMPAAPARPKASFSATTSSQQGGLAYSDEQQEQSWPRGITPRTGQHHRRAGRRSPAGSHSRNGAGAPRVSSMGRGRLASRSGVCRGSGEDPTFRRKESSDRTRCSRSPTRGRDGEAPS
jgi:hypothetical protein